MITYRKYWQKVQVSIRVDKTRLAGTCKLVQCQFVLIMLYILVKKSSAVLNHVIKLYLLAKRSIGTLCG